MEFNKKLLDIIVCPECKEELELKENAKGLKCNKCNRVFPIDDNGIPHLLLEEAEIEQ